MEKLYSPNLIIFEFQDRVVLEIKNTDSVVTMFFNKYKDLIIESNKTISTTPEYNNYDMYLLVPNEIENVSTQYGNRLLNFPIESQFNPLLSQNLTLEDQENIYWAISSLCKRHDVEYKFFNNLSYELAYLTQPICKVVDTTVDPIASGCEYTLIYSEDEVYNCRTFDEIVKFIFGVSQPKLRKITAENLFHYVESKGLPTNINNKINYNIYWTNKHEIDNHAYFKNDPIIYEKYKVCWLDRSFLLWCKILVESFDLDLVYNILDLIQNEFELHSWYNTTTYLTTDFLIPEKTKHFLSKIGYKKNIKILKKCNLNVFMFFRSLHDTISMYGEYRKLSPKLLEKGCEPIKIPKKFKDLTELHDCISRQYNRIKMIDELQEIGYTELPNHGKYIALNNQKYKDYVIKLPQDSVELVQWGEMMKNCVSGYIDRIMRDDCIVLGLEKDNQICYNIELKAEIKGFQIYQYSGINNVPVDVSEKQDFYRFVVDCNL